MTNPLNTGHGHVRPRPDGARARCGGPGICPDCSRDQVALNMSPRPQPTNPPRTLRETMAHYGVCFDPSEPLHAALAAYVREREAMTRMRCGQQFDRDSHIHGYSIRELIYETPLPSDDVTP